MYKGRLVQDSSSPDMGGAGDKNLSHGPTQCWWQYIGLFFGWLLGGVMSFIPVPPEMNNW